MSRRGEGVRIQHERPVESREHLVELRPRGSKFSGVSLQLFHGYGGGGESNFCPEVVEKIWGTVARGRRPRASFPDLLHYRGTII